MFRNIGAMLAAMVMGVGIVMLGDIMSSRFHPAPEGLNLQDTAALQAYVATVPDWLKAMMVGYWALAVFAAAFTGRRFGGKAWTGWAPAILLAVFIAMNLVAIPHPYWMKVSAGLAVALAAYAGVRLGAVARKPPPDEPPLA